MMEDQQMAANNGALRFKVSYTEDEITRVLGPLESQIMQLVWQMQQATASDVHHELLRSGYIAKSENRKVKIGNPLSTPREGGDIAYTTVMTTMSRLHGKHILRRRKVGMSFVYTPAFD